MRKFLFVTTLLSLMSSAYANTSLTENDIPNMVYTAKNNEPRFNRDYKGKIFVISGVFNSAREIIGNYLVNIKTEHNYIVLCETNFSNFNKVADFENDKTVIEIIGEIYNTSFLTPFGDIVLTNCSINKSKTTSNEQSVPPIKSSSNPSKAIMDTIVNSLKQD